MNLKNRDFLTLLDYSPEEIRYLLDLSKDLKQKKHNNIEHEYLKGKNIVLLFEKTSTRTRCSFEVAGHDLGMGVTFLNADSSQVGKKESIKDTELPIVANGSLGAYKLGNGSKINLPLSLVS